MFPIFSSRNLEKMKIKKPPNFLLKDYLTL